MSMTSKGVSATHHTYWQLGHLGGPSLAVLHTQPGQSPKRSHAQANVSLQSVWTGLLLQCQLLVQSLCDSTLLSLGISPQQEGAF